MSGLFSDEYLRDFEVYIGGSYTPSNNRLDTEHFLLCHHYTGVIAAGNRVNMQCSESAPARYVAIQKNDTLPLQLCEVQVYTELGI